MIADVEGMSSALPVPITRHSIMLKLQLIIYGVVWVRIPPPKNIGSWGSW